MTPEQEQQVSRALAGLGREDPAGPTHMPPQVAARLDAVLTELAASRDRPDELAARRRRRWPHALVAAAAAAVVVGGLVGVLRGMGANGSGGSASSARPPATGGSPARSSTAGPERSLAEGALAVPELHTSTIDRDVRRAVRAPAAGARLRPLHTEEPRSPAVGGCVVPAARPGDRLVAVRLDGRRAVLLLSPAEHGSRTARVYACTDPGNPVTTTTVPAR